METMNGAAAMAFTPDTLGEFSPSARAFRALYDAVGPAMHRNLVSEPVTLADRPAFAAKGRGLPPVLRFNHDEGHAGRMTVFGTDGGSVAFDWAMSHGEGQARWDFVKEHLALGDRDVGENCILSPGLNTLHQPTEGEQTAPERMYLYVKLLSGMKMAHMHTGTSMDQGEFRLNLSSAIALRATLNNLKDALESAGLAPRYEEDGTVVWDPRQLDRIQVALSSNNLIDTPLKINFRKLFAADEAVVLLAYSRAALDIDAALRAYREERIAAGESAVDLEARLRKHVTVVTIGNASRSFIDGPAYIHLAAWNDPLTKARGVHGRQTQGAGKDAVFLNCESPYNPDSFDNHNFGALTGQFLAVVMQANKVTGFRELYDKAQSGPLSIPEDADALTRALIQVSRGYDWLFNAETAWADVPHGALPEQDDAVRLLTERFGEEWTSAMVQSFQE